MFPSGAIKAVIVCGQLPSAAWQRLMMMMMMRIGMMASNVDPTESTVQLLVCCLKKKHHQSHRIIWNLDLCFPVGVLAMPKRKRRTRNGETVKLVTTLKHHIFFGLGVWVGPFPETYWMSIIGTWPIKKPGNSQQPWWIVWMTIVSNGSVRLENSGQVAISEYLEIHGCVLHSLSLPCLKYPGKIRFDKACTRSSAKRSYVFNLVLFGAMLCCVEFPSYTGYNGLFSFVATVHHSTGFGRSDDDLDTWVMQQVTWDQCFFLMCSLNFPTGCKIDLGC